ncbi:MAG: sugar phosphate isomerase/epimerase, partial [Clostridia bacterium]|nr:sugar phosphate isomerase/epimerase [Clostridia bacterium]
MYKRQLCITLTSVGNETLEEKFRLIKEAGFDGFFEGYESDEQIDKLRKFAREYDLLFQSIHAPFHKAADVWREGEVGEIAIREIYDTVDSAFKHGVEVVVAHAYIGFDTGEKPTNIGVDRVGKLVEYAKERGVKVAYENTEGEEFLETLISALNGYDNFGYCWDTGHEQCYNYSQDTLAKYGKRVFATHINDNLGVRDFNGKTTWHDDLHLLPYDGIIDWRDAMARLVKTGFDGPLT